MRIEEIMNAIPDWLKSLVSPVIKSVCGSASDFPVLPLGSNESFIGTSRLYRTETTRFALDLLNFAIHFRNISVLYFAFVLEPVSFTVRLGVTIFVDLFNQN